MSGDLLRQAAAILRERAEGANDGYQPGDEDPWFAVPDANSVRTKWVAFAEAYEAEAPYIATMHPGVGLALADWLDAETERAEYRERQQRDMEATRVRPEPFGVYYDTTTNRAIEVARLIVGGAR